MEKIKKTSKMILVFRKDLNCRKGKIGAQCGHAALKAILDIGKYTPDDNDTSLVIHIGHGSALEDWLYGLFTKICVSVNSEQELLDIYNKAKADGLICSLITDAGLTEFKGVPTITCCAIGPAWSDEVDPITGHLPLF